MSIYTSDFLASLTDGQLADHLFEMRDIDPGAATADAKAICAEVEKRGLSERQLNVAWHYLVAETATRD